MRSLRVALTASVFGAGLACQPLVQHQAQAQQQAQAPTPGPSQAQSAAAAAAGGPTVFLVNSASHWRAQGAPQYALRELDRVLNYDPNNLDVLAMAAEIAMEISDGQAAEHYRSQLRQIAPNDPRNAVIAAEQPRTPAETQMLADARRLVQAGKHTDAVLLYRKLFGAAAVPRSLAVEYYSTLASTPDGLTEATDGLGALAEQSPGDSRFQFAYAHLLVRDEGSRSKGITRLSELAKDSDVGIDARRAWRETLLWQGASEKARTQLQTYLASNVTDPEVETKRKEYDAILPDEGTKALIRGYNVMATDLDAARREFNATLAFNPNNPDAMVMLAAIDRKQAQAQAAQDLIDRAVAIAPDRRAELIHSAGGDYPVVAFRGTGDTYSASAYAISQLASVAAKQRRFDDAEALYAKAADLYGKANNRAGAQLVSVGRATLAKERTQQAATDRPARLGGRQRLAQAAPLPADASPTARRFASLP